MNYLLPERLDRLAREYALGTLTGPARRRFERLLRDTPAARSAVEAWQERLSGLASTVPALQPARVSAGRTCCVKLTRPSRSIPSTRTGTFTANGPRPTTSTVGPLPRGVTTPSGLTNAISGAGQVQAISPVKSRTCSFS